MRDHKKSDGSEAGMNDNAAGTTAPAKRRFELHPAGGLELDTSCDYLIKGLMPKAELLVLYGPPGTGKSFLALDAALHVAAGRDWAGRKVREPVGVVYVASEGARGFRKRVIAAMGHHGFPDDIPFALIEEAPDLTSAKDLKRLIADIEAQSAHVAGGPSLIVLDTLARSIGQVNESDTTGMNTFVANAKALSERFDALIMPVHHSGKDLERGMRGSSALQGAADAVWCLKREDDLTSFEVQKMKDGADGFSKVFDLLKRELGVDEDGDPIETLVIGAVREASSAEKKKKPAKDPGDQSRTGLVLELTRAVMAASGTVAANGKPRADGLDAAVKALPVRELSKLLKSRLMEGMPNLKDDRSRGAVVSAEIKKLESRGVLRKTDKWVWLTATGTPERAVETPVAAASAGAGAIAEDAPKAA